MIFRFSLYGFLKNLRFFDAFLLLALHQRGVGFLGIGGLIAAREIASNLSQIPSGALADAIGRKRCMVIGMAGYVASYLALGFANSAWVMVAAMVMFGTADSFRDGTHKALIYAWLRQQGRENERTKVYGFTRSWSKLGSALSAVIAAALVFYTGNFSIIFICSAIPAAINLVNLATYPDSLDDMIPKRGGGLRRAWDTLREGVHEVVSRPPLRRLVADSVSVEGGYAVMKDYLQVVAQACAAVWLAHTALDGTQQAAVVSGASYFLLHVLSSRASLRAHQFERSSGGTEPAVMRIMGFMAIGSIGLGIVLATGLGWLAMLILMGLGILQNVWRPIHIGRFDRDGKERHAATLLSVESQAGSLAAALWAPLVGALIDALSHDRALPALTSLWPVALGGLPVAWCAARRRMEARALVFCRRNVYTFTPPFAFCGWCIPD